MYQSNIKKIFLFFIFPMIVWTVTYFLNNIFLSYLSSLLGFFLSIKFLINLLRKNFSFRPLLTSSVLIIIFTNLSWIVSSFFGYVFYQQNIFYNIEVYFNINPNNFIFSIIYTYIFCILCLFLSFTKNNLKEEIKISFTLKKIKFYDLKKLLQINLIILIIEIYLLSVGAFGYRSYNIEGYNDGIIKWYIPFLNYLIYFQIPLLIFIFNHKHKKKFTYLNLQLIFSICVLLIIFISKNRRDIIFLFLQFLFWYSIINRKIYLKKILFPAIISIFIGYQGANYNNIIRSELNTEYLKNKSFLNIISETTQSKNLEQLKLEQSSKILENLATRPLTLSTLARLFETPDNEKRFLFGKNIFNNLIWTIPRFIYPNKVNTPIAENLINENFKVDFLDRGLNLIILSYVDFSYSGLIIYPLLLYLFWNISLKIINSKNISDLIKIYMIASTFNILINSFEIATLAYLFTLRNLLIIFLISKIFNGKFFKT